MGNALGACKKSLLSKVSVLQRSAATLNLWCAEEEAVYLHATKVRTRVYETSGQTR